MDPLALLQEVAEAYRKLATLAIEAVAVTESGDEDASSRSEQRVRFYYQAPDRMRCESGRKHGYVEVADGIHLHRIFGRPGFAGGPQYNSIPLSKMHQFPHFFRTDFPLVGSDHAFLFTTIADRVADARIPREEDGCDVLAVAYEPSPYGHHFQTGPVVLFWVSKTNRMVLKQQGDVGHRRPAEEEVTWSRHTLSVRTMQLNEPIPPEIFQFTPPPEARQLAAGGGCGVSVGGGAGFVERGSDGRQRLEHWGSHEWEGQTLVQRSKWKIRGMTLLFDRRMTFSHDEKELRIVERYKGPAGEKETTCTLPVG